MNFVLLKQRAEQTSSTMIEGIIKYKKSIKYEILICFHYWKYPKIGCCPQHLQTEYRCSNLLVLLLLILAFQTSKAENLKERLRNTIEK